MKALDTHRKLKRHSLMNILGIPIMTEVTFTNSFQALGREADILRMPVQGGDYAMALDPTTGQMLPNFTIDYHAIDGDNPIQ